MSSSPSSPRLKERPQRLQRLQQKQHHLNYANVEINDMVFGHHHEPFGMTNAEAEEPSPETQPTSRTDELCVQLQIVPLEIATATDKDAGHNSRTTASREKLESCPGESGHRENPSVLGREGVKRPRDALARYFSNANSFPDYGAPKHSDVMSAKDWLKRINSNSRHINTLGSQRSNADDGLIAPQPKRQRQDSHSDAQSDHFLPFARSPRQLRSYDAVNGSSQTDPFEIQSTTSSAANAKSVLTNLHEYRRVQPMRRKRKNRTRASRSTKSPSKQDLSTFGSDGETGSIIVSHSARADLSPRSESLDDLSLLEPSPSRITSDIVQQRRPKRDGRSSVPESPECQVKRKRPSASNDDIEDSEDELHRDSFKGTMLHTRGNNSPQLGGGSFSDRRERFRGDISKTRFSMSSSNVRSRKPGAKGMALMRAVSGKKTYQRDDQCSLFLHQNSQVDTKLEPRNEAGEAMNDMSWLVIDVTKIQQARWSSSSGCHVLIHRSISIETAAAAKLFLQFETPEDTAALAQILKSYAVRTGELYVPDFTYTKTRKLTDPENDRDGVVEKAMENAWGEAISYAASNNNNHIQEEIDQQLTSSLDGASRAPESSIHNSSLKTEKIKDRLLRSSNHVDPENAKRQPAAPHYDIETRSSSRLTSGCVSRRPNLESWTDAHPEWHKDWPRSLVFPATGKNRTIVDQEDILRLNEGEFLNDNLISFYFRYLQSHMEQECPELLNKVYIFNTFFFEKLKSTRGKINYEGVKAWTAKVDLLSYEYIVVPVNEHAHWYLAIICNAPNAVRDPNEEALPQAQSSGAPEILDVNSSPRPSTREGSISGVPVQDELSMKKQTRDTAPQVTEISSLPSSPTGKRKLVGTTSKNDLSQPKIITLDSLGSTHTPTCKALKEYLIQEAKSKRGIDLANPPTGMTARKIPEQDNFCDCGVFVLGYMREFLKHPEEAASKLLQKVEVEWEINPSELRNQVRSLLFDLQKKQNERLELERQQRRSLLKKKKMAEEKQRTSPTTSPATPHPSLTPSMPGAYPMSPPERPEREPRADQDTSGPAELTEQERDVVAPEQSHIAQGAQGMRYLGTLVTDSGSSPEVNEEPCFSASTSPKPDLRRGRLVVELKAKTPFHDRTEHKTRSGLDDGTEPPVVHDLISSGSESRPTTRNISGRKGRRLSIEFMEERKAQPSSSARARSRQADDDWDQTSRYFRPIQSIEDDGVDELEEKKPKYDGIARSIDLTLS